MTRNFTSDNITPACDAIMAAINAANTGFVASYGADDFTTRLQKVASEVFETEVVVFPLATGTAANALALSQLVPPFGGIYCYDAAHIATDEGGAPEFFSGGAKLIGLPAADGKIQAPQLADAIEFAHEMGVHHVKPAAVSLTQATEWGTVYDVQNIAAIAAVARTHGLPVHMDGARFANAMVYAGCTPAEMTWKSGIDVLSLGATKNGALCAEAAVFFDPLRAREFDRRRKRAGHLWSKLRFVSAQLLAYLEDDLWLKNAGHANAMALQLAGGLQAISGAHLLHPVQANEIFIAMPEALIAGLEQRGYGFYRWPLAPADTGVAIRLVTSYATSPADVAALIAAAAGLAAH